MNSENTGAGIVPVFFMSIPKGIDRNDSNFSTLI